MSTNRFDRPDPIDPELRELLREIAARQESQLMRPRSARNVRELLGEGEWLRAGATGLSTAERHLLTHYREEAAFLLRELARERLRDSPRFQRMFLVRSGRLRSGDPHTSSRLLECLEREMRAFSEDYERESRAAEPGVAVRLAQNSRATASALARCSLQLEPSSEARLCLAADLVRTSSFGAACSSYSRIAQLAASPFHRACALGGHGLALAKRGEYEASLEAHRRAVTAHPAEPGHAWNWLCYSVQAGNEVQSREAISFIERELQPSESAVEQWISNALLQRTNGEWSKTAVAGHCAERVAATAGTFSGRILDVFL